MSGISFNDNLKGLLKNTTVKFQAVIGKKNLENAYLLHTLITKGFRDQKYASQYEALHPETIARKKKRDSIPDF